MDPNQWLLHEWDGSSKRLPSQPYGHTISIHSGVTGEEARGYVPLWKSSGEESLGEIRYISS